MTQSHCKCQCRDLPVTSWHAQLTFWVLVKDKAADKADENGHEGAAGNIGGVARVCLQCALLQHAVLVPDTSRIRPACSKPASQLVPAPRLPSVAFLHGVGPQAASHIVFCILLYFMSRTNNDHCMP